MLTNDAQSKPSRMYHNAATGDSMELPRQELLEALTTAKPALATKEIVEECCCAFFDGKALTTFNDTLGIRVPFKSPFTGGVRGSLLIGMLSNSRAKDVTVEPLTDGNALFKAGRTLLKLSLLPLEQAVYEIPKLKGDGFCPDSAFWLALERVCVALGSNLTAPEQLGVSIAPTRAGLNFYATDASTLCETSVEADWPQLKERITVPSVFIEQLLKIKDGKTKLHLTGGAISAVNKEGVMVFSRLVSVPKPSDFEKTINDCLKGVKFFSIPRRLPLALERASVLLSTESNVSLTMEIMDDQLQLRAKTSLGDLKDTIGLEEANGNIQCRTNPDLVKRALEYSVDIALSEQVILLQSKGFRYVVSNFR